MQMCMYILRKGSTTSSIIHFSSGLKASYKVLAIEIIRLIRQKKEKIKQRFNEEEMKKDSKGMHQFT